MEKHDKRVPKAVTPRPQLLGIALHPGGHASASNTALWIYPWESELWGPHLSVAVGGGGGERLSGDGVFSQKVYGCPTANGLPGEMRCFV